MHLLMILDERCFLYSMQLLIVLLCMHHGGSRKVRAQWEEKVDEENENDQADHHSEAESEESDVKISCASSEPEVEEEAPAKVVIDRDQKDFHGILPGTIAN